MKIYTILGMIWAWFMCVAPTAWSSPLTSFQGQTMGTTYSLKIADPVKDLNSLKKHVAETLEQVNNVASTYRQQSEISRFNRSRSTQWVGVSPLLASWVQSALKVKEITSGSFDITAMKLVDLWGFGPQAVPRQIPDAVTLGAALRDLRKQTLQVRLKPPALKKSHEDMAIDLSGIAKGAGVDMLAQLLKERGYRNFFVEIGGELRTQGKKQHNLPWRVAIERPSSRIRGLQKILQLNTAAMATSGDYRNYFEQDGKRFAHIIDPRSGRPITHQLASVTVIANTCELADAFATAFMVIGLDRAMKIAKEQGLEALFIVRDRGQFKEIATAGFGNTGRTL